PVAIPRITPGSSSWVTWPTGSRENSTKPVTGRQPHQIAGSTIRSVASQNGGTDSPRGAALRATETLIVSWRGGRGGCKGGGGKEGGEGESDPRADSRPANPGHSL